MSNQNHSAYAELVRTVKDLTAGTIGGCAGIVAGQPLDTIKVRMQSQQTAVYKNTLDTFVKTLQHDGFLGLYKGMASPLIGNAPLNAIAFGAFGNAMRELDKHFPKQTPALTLKQDGSGKYEYESLLRAQRPQYSRLFVAGFWAGLVQCIVSTPTELIKCRLQVQTGGKALYAGPWDCMRSMVKHSGFRSLFRGFAVTCARDAPGFGGYWVSYDWAKYTFGGALQPGDRHATPVLLAAGGVAGVVTWAITYPFDVVKSVIQTAPDSTPRAELKIWPVMKTNYAAHGLSFFFRGIGPTLVRAVPVNAVTFYVYESSMRFFNGMWPEQ